MALNYMIIQSITENSLSLNKAYIFLLRNTTADTNWATHMNRKAQYYASAFYRNQIEKSKMITSSQQSCKLAMHTQNKNIYTDASFS